MSSPKFAIETIVTEDGVSGLEADWDRLSLAAERPNVFATYGWFQAWYRRFGGSTGGKQRPNVVVFKREGVVTGLSPLVGIAASRFGIALRRLQFVSRQHEWDYNDLVVGEDVPGQTEALVESLARSTREWDLVDLQALRDTAGTIAHLEGTLQRAGLHYRIFPEEERCPYMTIDGPWQQMLEQRSRSMRRTFRSFAQMARDGLRVRFIERPDQEPGLLEKLIAVEAQKQVGGEPSIAFLGRYPEVFRSIFDTLGPQGWITVVLMEWNGRVMAWQLLYRCGRSLWGYLTAFDRSFAEHSPGTMLIPSVIDYCVTQGLEEFDFLNGEEDYKLRWASGFHDTYRVLIWNRRPISRLGAQAYLRLRIRPKAHAAPRAAD